LVQRLSEEEASRLIAARTETDQVRPAKAVYSVWVDPNKRAKDRNAKKGLTFQQCERPKDSICKSWHNVGGKS